MALTYRLRYYFAWAVSESSLIFSGLCFNGYDNSTGRARWGSIAHRVWQIGVSCHCTPCLLDLMLEENMYQLVHRWDRCVNTRIRKVELSDSAARLPADWNIATGNFLRRCEPSSPVPALSP